MRFKKNIPVIISLISSIALSLPVYADTAYYPEKQVTDLIEKYDELYKSDNTEAWEHYLSYSYYAADDSANIFLYDTESDFKNGADKLIVLSYEIFPLKNKSIEETVRSPYYNPYFSFELFSTDDNAYKARYKLPERAVYTVKEIIRDSGIDDITRIGLVGIIYYAGERFKDITGYDFYDYTPGWNTIDGNTYYITSDGTIITKSVIIDDVRYKFTKDGVCHGKYSGFTRSKNGLRYYKDGVIIKNKCIRFTDGRIYIADKDGYLTKQA